MSSKKGCTTRKTCGKMTEKALSRTLRKYCEEWSAGHQTEAMVGFGSNVADEKNELVQNYKDGCSFCPAWYAVLRF